MNFLSVSNSYMKPQNNTFLLSESPSRNAFLNDNRTPQITENNNQISSNGNDKTIQEVWTKHNFETNKVTVKEMHNFNNIKMSWANENTIDNNFTAEKTDEEIEDVKMEAETSAVDNNTTPEKSDNTSPSHHARRPMNAFLIFCKKHRPIVRDKFPNLENRGVTRILGEWWALLETEDKQPFSDLAKEYKDAFLSANPDFKWYKLPAPPLRTLSTRPPAIHQKIPVPLSSPSNNNIMKPEFTPGKLADESQLGGLTSLMNNNFSSKPKTSDCCKQTDFSTDHENNNNNSFAESNGGNCDPQISPVNFIKTTLLPPKPIKKRIFEQYVDNKDATRNILSSTACDEAVTQEINELNIQNDSNMTNQDLMNKVVDDMFAKQVEEGMERNGLNDSKDRKSDRLCKGKRYEKFMHEGKLLGNKRDTKLTQQKYFKIDSKIESELNKLENQTPKLDLSNTIKRLAERTNVKVEFDGQKEDENVESNSKDIEERVRTISENSDTSTRTSPTSSFNLELRITNLPSLSYDMFLQRKKESKKRKIRTKTDGESKHKLQKLDKNDKQLVGSKKRKNKRSITHIGKKDDTNLNNDLIGLATLAEVAANTEKINEKISE